MTNGERLNNLKNQFCSQSNTVKNILRNCPYQFKLANYLSNKLKCGDNEYTNIIQQNKYKRKQELRDIFNNPDKLEKEFRTQKELDDAWDELKKEHSFNFKSWLIYNL